MKLIYKPFGIVLGLLASIVSRQVFSVIWSRLDDSEPPKPTTRDATWGRVLAATAVKGMTSSVTKAIVQRSGARAFAYLTGAWPGEARPEPK